MRYTNNSQKKDDKNMKILCYKTYKSTPVGFQIGKWAVMPYFGGSGWHITLVLPYPAKWQRIVIQLRQDNDDNPLFAHGYKK